MTQPMWSLALAFVLVTPAMRPVPPSSHPDAGRFVAGATITAVSIEWTENDRLVPSGCVECYEMLFCSVLGHVAYLQNGAEWSLAHDDCRDKRYCEGHPPCSYSQTNGSKVDPVALHSAIYQLSDRDDLDAVTFVERFPANSSLNLARHALQVTGTCPQEGLIGSFPLTAAQESVIAHVLAGNDHAPERRAGE